MSVQLTIEINRESDLQLVRALLQRLKIRFTQTPLAQKTPSTVDEEHLKLLQHLASLIPPRENWDEFYAEWEASRKEHPLPFREN